MSDNNDKKLGLFLLIGLGVGSMIGSGIFNSPTDLVSSANPQAVIIAWIIGGLGVLMLALIFQFLSNKKPELTGGIYSYAKAGFGEFVGFNSAWGYWLSAFLGNVAYFTVIFKTINSILGKGHELSSITIFILGSILLWFYHFMICRGIKNASIVNAIITIGKILPLLLVIIFGLIAFNSGLFNVANWKTVLASTGSATTLKDQVSGAMGTVLWCFIGIEASVVMSTRAKNSKIVGKATVISFITVLILYMLISLIPMGVVGAKDLANAGTPLADVLAKTPLGSAGSMIVSIGLLISVLGALISWVLLTAEILHVAAVDGVMPKWLAKENKAGVPVNSLIFSNGATQLFLFFLLVPQLQKAYSTAFTLATVTVMVPYLLSALYATKVSVTENGGAGNIIVSVLASIYSIYVLYAVGFKYLALGLIMYAFGVIPLYIAKKEKNQKFSKNEGIAQTLIIIGAIIMIILLAKGKISM